MLAGLHQDAREKRPGNVAGQEPLPVLAEGRRIPLTIPIWETSKVWELAQH
jgi:hypothetical protein